MSRTFKYRSLVRYNDQYYFVVLDEQERVGLCQEPQSGYTHNFVELWAPKTEVTRIHRKHVRRDLMRKHDPPLVVYRNRLYWYDVPYFNDARKFDDHSELVRYKSKYMEEGEEIVRRITFPELYKVKPIPFKHNDFVMLDRMIYVFQVRFDGRWWLLDSFGKKHRSRELKRTHQVSVSRALLEKMQPINEYLMNPMSLYNRIVRLEQTIKAHFPSMEI